MHSDLVLFLLLTRRTVLRRLWLDLRTRDIDRILAMVQRHPSLELLKILNGRTIADWADGEQPEA